MRWTRRQPIAPESCVRHGFTLIEVAMVVVIVGAMAILALPHLNRALDQANANGAKTQVAEWVNKARFAAITRSGLATLTITPNGSIWVTAPKLGAPGLIDTVGTVDNLVTRYGIALVAPTNATTLSFDSQGVGTATSNTLVIVSRGSTVDTLNVSASGRTSL